MKGYFNHPKLTSEVIDEDGWFHTGDIGELDEDGFLKITDRKKEMFKTSGGKYVAPQIIESKLKSSPFIEYVLVTGENRKCPAAIVLPDFNFLQSWCLNKKIPFSTIDASIENPQVWERFKKEIDLLNAGLDKVQQVKRFALISDEWTTESGELSPTLKLRRKFISGKYRELITLIYRDSEDEGIKKCK
jgi:long-chain acyl-CoA synthetase